MTYYGGKEMASAFRTVRNNTLIIAEEIPEVQYSFSGAEGFRTVAELLTHLVLSGSFYEQVNFIEKRKTMVAFDFMSLMSRTTAESQKKRSKTEIIQFLKDDGDKWAALLESSSDEFLAETVEMPPGGSPSWKTRFEMLLGLKEHEIHHRGQLMLIERMLGITPHLTRQGQVRMAAMREAHARREAEAGKV